MRCTYRASVACVGPTGPTGPTGSPGIVPSTSLIPLYGNFALYPIGAVGGIPYYHAFIGFNSQSIAVAGIPATVPAASVPASNMVIVPVTTTLVGMLTDVLLFFGGNPPTEVVFSVYAIPPPITTTSIATLQYSVNLHSLPTVPQVTFPAGTALLFLFSVTGGSSGAEDEAYLNLVLSFSNS